MWRCTRSPWLSLHGRPHQSRQLRSAPPTRPAPPPRLQSVLMPAPRAKRQKPPPLPHAGPLRWQRSSWQWLQQPFAPLPPSQLPMQRPRQPQAYPPAWLPAAPWLRPPPPHQPLQQRHQRLQRLPQPRAPLRRPLLLWQLPALLLSWLLPCAAPRWQQPLHALRLLLLQLFRHALLPPAPLLSLQLLPLSRLLQRQGRPQQQTLLQPAPRWLRQWSLLARQQPWQQLLPLPLLHAAPKQRLLQQLPARLQQKEGAANEGWNVKKREEARPKTMHASRAMCTGVGSPGRDTEHSTDLMQQRPPLLPSPLPLLAVPPQWQLRCCLQRLPKRPAQPRARPPRWRRRWRPPPQQPAAPPAPPYWLPLLQPRCPPPRPPSERQLMQQRQRLRPWPPQQRLALPQRRRPPALQPRQMPAPSPQRPPCRWPLPAPPLQMQQLLPPPRAQQAGPTQQQPPGLPWRPPSLRLPTATP